MEAQDFTKFAGVDQFEAAVKAGVDTFEKTLKAGKQNADKAYKTSTDAVVKNVDKAFEIAKDQVEAAFPQAAPKFAEFAELSKGNLNAAMAAGAIAKKGFEAIADEMIAANQEAFEETLSRVKSLLEVKSYNEWFDLQAAYARGAFDKTVEKATKFSDMSAKVAGEIAEPLQARFAKVSEKYGKTA